MITSPTVVELCVGAGGLALGLERAGFVPRALVELDPDACATLRLNRPSWPILCDDVRDINPGLAYGHDLLAAGIPCPPFSRAGHQLGADDPRDLFPALMAFVRASSPRAVLVENVPGLLDRRFATYRTTLLQTFADQGYEVTWDLLDAVDFGVPQRRARAFLVALRTDRRTRALRWPRPNPLDPTTAGEALLPFMAHAGWAGAQAWARRASAPAPTLVGGSRLHGGADLGPTRTRAAWARLGVEARSLADAPPGAEAPPDLRPRLTLAMAARLQGFPDDWRFAGGKTTVYRQVGNACPPALAEAVGRAIREALEP